MVWPIEARQASMLTRQRMKESRYAPILGIKRVSSEKLYKDGLPEDALLKPFWIDHVLWDTPNTMVIAVGSAHAAGARAVTVFEHAVKLAIYRPVVQECQRLGMTVIVAEGPEFKRRIYWQPE